RRGEFRQHAGATALDRADTPVELNAIGGAGELLQEWPREVDEYGVFAGDGIGLPGGKKITRRGEGALSLACCVESLDHSTRGGDEMKVAVNGVVRPQLAVGSRKVGYFVPRYLNVLHGRAGMLLLGRGAFLIEVGPQQKIVLGMEYK